MRLSLRNVSGLAIARLILGAGAAAGCGGPSVSDIAVQRVTLTLQGVASAPEVASIGEPAEGLGVARAVIHARAVRFEACEKNVEPLVLDPRAYELLHDPAPSESISTAVSEWCGLQVDIGPARASETDEEPAAAIYVEVTDESGEAFTLTSDAVTTLRFETDAASSFGDQPLLLGVDVSKWLADLPLDGDASEQLAEQLKSAAALYVDANGNGRLDDDEVDAIAQSEP